MSTPPFFHWRFVIPGILSLAMVVSVFAINASGATTPIQISTDSTTTGGAQHQTEIEPAVAANGSTIVATFQEGRFAAGGSAGIGFATSTDGGATWTHTGTLSGIIGSTTIFSGNVAFATNPQVAYDSVHNTWMIMSIGLSSSLAGIGIMLNTSSDGITWNSAVDIDQSIGNSWDKPSLVCDNVSATFKGHCYAEWDDLAAGQALLMSSSSNGGSTWSTPINAASSPHGFSGNAVVSPNGNVVIPFSAPNQTSINTITSVTGGVSWTTGITITNNISSEPPPFGMGNSVTGSTANGMRLFVLPTAAADKNGDVYIAWQEVNFESLNCCFNDIVLAKSTNGGLTWTAPTAPILPANSGNDQFLPALAADPNVAGDVALEYFYIPNAAALNGQSSSSCTASGTPSPQCQIFVGFTSSTNSGATWSPFQQIAGPMTIPHLAVSTAAPAGAMLGDYITMAFLNDAAWPVFPLGAAPTGSNTVNEAMYTIPGGILVGNAPTATPTPTGTTTSTPTSTSTPTATGTPATATSTPTATRTGTPSTATPTPTGTITKGTHQIVLPLVVDNSAPG